MAIFDSEKRPRGLRMPSLTAMKQGTAAARSQFSFSSKKSNEPRTPDEDPPPTSSGDSFAPPEAAPPPTKDLPAIPRDQLPPPPRISPNVPARREVGSNAHPGQTSPTSPQGRRRPAPPMIDTAPLSEPQPEFQPQPPMRSERRLQPELRTSPPQSPQSQMQPQPQEQPQWQFSPPTPPPVTLLPPTVQGNEDETPLEDFIPTPDPGSPLEPVSSDEPAPPDTPPLELEVVAAPLTKVHFACFQEHRNMPVSQNVWCPVPCMTCQKFDREIRHRCVFCCLRICGSCHQALMKCKNRSLEELMESLNRD